MLERSADCKRRARRVRNQAYRQRLRGGSVVAPVTVDGAILDLLVRFNWLAEGDATDRVKIGEAIARLLRDACS
jgi:hypothetical protein